MLITNLKPKLQRQFQGSYHISVRIQAKKKRAKTLPTGDGIQPASALLIPITILLNRTLRCVTLYYFFFSTPQVLVA